MKVGNQDLFIRLPAEQMKTKQNFFIKKILVEAFKIQK